MKDGKLKALEDEMSEIMSRWVGQLGATNIKAPITIAELRTFITAYRQLEKDNARLQKANDELFGQMTEESDRADKAEEAQAEQLAALKQINIEAVASMPLNNKLAALACIRGIAIETIDKHKGESELREKYPKTINPADTGDCPG